MTSLLLLGWVASSLASASSPPVEVEVQSSWPAPPLLLEILCVDNFAVLSLSNPRLLRETISVQEPNSFFPLLEATTNPERSPSIPPTSPKAIHDYVVATAIAEGLLTHPGALASVSMDLALHTSSPKIEAFFQYYTDQQKYREANISDADCESWVDWYGQVLCGVEDLEQHIGVESIEPPNGSNV